MPTRSEEPSGKAGTAYIWGSGKDGRCGNRTQNSEPMPWAMNGIALKKIRSGYHHTAGISSDGICVTWGRGVFG